MLHEILPSEQATETGVNAPAAPEFRGKVDSVHGASEDVILTSPGPFSVRKLTTESTKVAHYITAKSQELHGTAGNVLEVSEESVPIPAELSTVRSPPTHRTSQLPIHSN